MSIYRDLSNIGIYYNETYVASQRCSRVREIETYVFLLNTTNKYSISIIIITISVILSVCCLIISWLIGF